MAAERAYLDYNASAPLLDEAKAAMMAILGCPGNASSVHGEGRAKRAVIDRARRHVAQLCNASADNVVFTSGATEAASTLLTPEYRMGRGSLAIGHLYVLASDHPCLLGGGHFAADQITQLPVDTEGLVDLEALRSELGRRGKEDGQALVACHFANNESGVVQPVADIAKVVKDAGGLLVVDAVQAVGRLEVDIEALGADFLILSSHKIGGPQGAGAIVAASDLLMPSPLVTGGGQEKGHRAGTENVGAIAGFGEAARIARERLDGIEAVRDLRNRFETVLRTHIADAIIVAEQAPRLANTSLFIIPGLKTETAQIAFDLAGIALSAGSACSSGKVGDSHVLAAMGLGSHGSALRLSIGAETGERELVMFEKAVRGIAERRAEQGKAA
ncbi:MAG: cysteine desulfurase family protein [Rhizobiaceae bacterium]